MLFRPHFSCQESPSGQPPDVGPAGPLGPCPLCPLLLPLARIPRGGAWRFALAMAGCPMLPALRGPVHRPRRVPPTAYIGGGFWLFTSGGARAPRPDGGGPPGRCLDSPSSPLGRAHSSWATPGPVPARSHLLARLGVLACKAVFPSPVVLSRLAAPCALPCSFPFF